ncbi:polysaccharide lyase family 1 protein [Aulographum hederae CBS 113979]|uniref:pectate lyase n=1 Tax=Aulographum hederae CBS 113979 TaxID=1176131 RepID=A0A6G1H3I7_9PEZI|nr:polysaccharide lyase family 1 protein [Aulographum hederae CBS 113979]
MRFSTIAALLSIAASVVAAPAPQGASTEDAEAPAAPAAPAAPGAASLQDVATTGYATMNGGTTGGKGGKVVQVSTWAALQSAVQGDAPAIVVVSGSLRPTSSGKKGAALKIGSNKTIVGKDNKAVIMGGGLSMKGVKNVIIRNLTIQKVLAPTDAIGIQDTTNVWVDHVDLSSDMTHDKDYYDGLLDITHAGDFVTVSNSYLHDHYKASLVGHSDSNGAEDRGHLRVTYHNNYWKNLNSRGPSLRFGTGHVYNNYYENMNDAINTRQNAQVLVQSNVFVGSSKPLYNQDGGKATQMDNNLGSAKTANVAAAALKEMPYKSTILPAVGVKAAVVGQAGATLTF